MLNLRSLRLNRFAIVGRGAVLAAKRKLEESEDRYRELFDQNPLPAWIYDRKTLRLLAVNQMAVAQYGYSRDEFLRMQITDIRMHRESDPAEGSSTNRGAAPGRSGPWHHKLKDGRQIVVELTACDLDWLGVPARLVMIHDITERVALEQKFRCVFERSNDAILLSLEGKIVDCNSTAVGMLRAAHKEEVVGRPLFSFLAEGQPGGITGAVVGERLSADIELSGRSRRDCLQRDLQGGEILVEFSASTVEIGGRVMQLVVWHDLTARRQAEGALRKSEARLREAQEIAGLGNWEVDLKSSKVEWSGETYRILGVSPNQEPLGINEFKQRVHPEDRGRLFALAERTIQTGIRPEIEYRLMRNPGEVRVIQSRAQRHVDDQGRPVRLSGTVIDITEQRQMDDALRASEARFHAFMEKSPCLAFIKDRDGRMQYMNRLCRSMWGFGEVDWIGRPDSELWSPELAAGFRKLDLRVFDTDASDFTIEEVPLPDGRSCWLMSHKFPIELPDGQRLVAGVSIDITPQKEAEMRALEALAEREVLLKEVHHRVKNNLQVICSLLALQTETIRDPQTRAALRDSQDRVQSMALIHELLYSSESLGEIDISDYVRRLVGELIASYELGSSRIQLRVDIKSVRLGVDRAIPCGLIVSELISNSLKYAFPDQRSGEIRVAMDERADHQLRLTVEDDGVGLPPEFSIDETRSLGLRIVRILTRQLDGSLEIQARGGSSFQVVFPAA